MDSPSYNTSFSPQGNKDKKGLFDSLPPKAAFFGGIIIAILVLGTVGFIILGTCVLKGTCGNINGANNNGTPTDNNNDTNTDTTQPAGIPAVSDSDYILGDKNASVTIIEYSDLQCPFCQRFHPTAKQIVEAYPGKVRWIFRHFPLSFHENARPAANAAECAGEQGKFYEFIEEAFANQEKLGTDLYKATAKKLGLNATKFNDCLTQNKYDAKIAAQASGGAAAGVSGTPATFVIGADGTAIPIKGALPYETVKQAVDSVLK